MDRGIENRSECHLLSDEDAEWRDEMNKLGRKLNKFVEKFLDRKPKNEEQFVNRILTLTAVFDQFIGRLDATLWSRDTFCRECLDRFHIAMVNAGRVNVAASALEEEDAESLELILQLLPEGSDEDIKDLVRKRLGVEE